MPKTYIGITVQIIQHEVDHCNGVLIEEKKEKTCQWNIIKANYCCVDYPE